MNKKVVDGFRTPRTKGTNGIVGPTSLLQTIRRPKPILKGSQAKNFTLGGAQIFQTDLLKLDAVAPKNCAL
jgi:hypothetical protein